MAIRRPSAKTALSLPSLSDLRQELKTVARQEYAEVAQRFFKTGKREYGEGDIFMGIRVPVLRAIAKRYGHLSLADTKQLLASTIHEERLVALYLLCQLYQAAREEKERQAIVDMYLASTRYVNNWDLVDSSAHKILGRHVYDRSEKVLYELARSSLLWERRIAIIATLWFISKQRYEPTLKVAKILLHDPHDLIHKAVGWMLREVGKRSQDVEEVFLRTHAHVMPRTMLRYAIERFSKEKRQRYLRMRSAQSTS